MKKFSIGIFTLLLFVSCNTTKQDKLVRALTKEFGKPIENLSDNSRLLYVWENVDIEKSGSTFDIADKTLEMLPTDKSRGHFYKEDDIIYLIDSNIYETPTFKISLENHAYEKKNSDFFVTVKLFIDNK